MVEPSASQGVTRTGLVVLVNPSSPVRTPGTRFTGENLALGYLSSSLAQEGATVRIIDCDLDGLTGVDIAAYVAADAPVMVGITALARNADDAIEIARAIAQRAPRCPILLGGLHFTYCASEVLEQVPEILAVVRGEGELSVRAVYRELLRTAQGSPGNWSEIGGLTYRDAEGKVQSNPYAPAIQDLDSLPLPDRQVLDRAVAQGLQPAIPMLSSRGCYAHCLFCNAARFYSEGGGSPWRHRLAPRVVDEMEQLLAQYDGHVDPVILFYDDTFIGPGTVGRRHAQAIAEEILRRGLEVKFETFLRADTFCDHPELVELLRKAGMVRAFLGIESADDQELKLFRKAITVEQIGKALHNLKRYRVSTPASGFIMFYPFSSFESLRRNARFLRELGHASIWNLSTQLDVYGGNGFVPLLQNAGLLTGSHGYGGYYTYRFSDSRVGEFASYMDISQHELVQRLDASGRAVEYSHANVLHELEEAGLAEDLASSHRVSGVLSAIHERSYNFFMRGLELFEQQGTEREKTEVKEQFFVDASSLADELEGAHRAFLLDVKGVLDRAQQQNRPSERSSEVG